MFAAGVNHVRNILRSLGTNGNAQSIYELVFVLWTLTLSIGPKVDVSRFLTAGVIPLLVELASSGPSRKVVRMCIGTLRNLAESQNADALTEMLTVGVQRLIESEQFFFFSARISFHWQYSGIAQAPKAGNTDPEFENDLRTLNELLTINYRELSTFDRWVSQVHAGSLRAGVVHQEKFWRENARFLEAEDFKLLRKLITFLKHEDPVSVEFAEIYEAFDLIMSFTVSRKRWN